MKKNLFYYLFAVICSVALFTSCSDDDDEKMVNPVPQTTFTGENGLQLTYNGAPMPGKKVTFTPDATNAQKALFAFPKMPFKSNSPSKRRVAF